jgi:hypothetical protein
MRAQQHAPKAPKSVAIFESIHCQKITHSNHTPKTPKSVAVFESIHHHRKTEAQVPCLLHAPFQVSEET